MIQYNTKTFTYPDSIVRVHIPILTETEREKRLHQLMDATERFIKEVERCKKEKTKLETLF